ncbi:general substrate transporter [Epithele typhae]|uniref:general substrate transporter n=1 Tax=Epithele typhae TaxID=378194 RepID=UPI00200807C0|nr:general substrate transporter [Epithele typhae]KAH9940131.1 general substrate transporter [Epithele typhae]
MTLLDRFRPTSFPRRYPRWMVGRPLLIGSSALASLGDAMFGYSQGVIGSLQVQPPFIRRFFGSNVTLEQIQAGNNGVDPMVQAITVSCLNITAFMSSLFAAYLCDVLGRRSAIRIGGIIYFVAAIFQVVAPTLAWLIFGRSLQGVGVGILSMTVPILQCEIAPGHARGMFISIEYIALNAGYALSTWVGFAFFFSLPSEMAWRGPYIIQAVFALVLILWSFILPETPRFLIKNGFSDEGLQVLADLHAAGDVDAPHVRATHASIVAATKAEAATGDASWRELFRVYGARTLVGVSCQVFAQCNGINAILYFLPENLARAGFSIERSLLYAAASALLFCTGTIPTMFGIDRLGRRPFLVVGSAGLAAGLAVVGGLQYYVDGLPLGPARLPGANGIFAAVCVYLWFYAATWGPGPWLLGAEIFPMRARAKGMALSNTANWLCNFGVAFATPPLFAALGAGFYFVLAGACVVSGVFVFFVYPETAHKTLEELGEAFGTRGAGRAGAAGGEGSGEEEGKELVPVRRGVLLERRPTPYAPPPCGAASLRVPASDGRSESSSSDGSDKAMQMSVCFEDSKE